MKWTTAYIKLLISMRKDNEKLFDTGRLRKKAIWSRIAQEFNEKVCLIIEAESCIKIITQQLISRCKYDKLR